MDFPQRPESEPSLILLGLFAWVMRPFDQGALLRRRTTRRDPLSSTTPLLRSMHEQYASELKLSPKARYFNGAPLRPVVPLDHATEGLFILGAYPSAKFLAVDGLTDVPGGDNRGPFEEERWFDGRRVRFQDSARELRKFVLGPMDVDREHCWITDLVKVFLFKSGHVARYEKLGASVPKGYTRDRFFELGEASIPWLARELEVAQPRLVVTLGAEVAGVLHGRRSAAAQKALLQPEVIDLAISGREYRGVHCAHPGILMREAPKNPWPRRHREEFVPVLRQAWG